MIVKFLPNQKGGSVKAIDYLLNNRKLEGTARVIQGDEQLTRDIINTIDRKQKVTVGVLSFQEENINEDQKHQIIASFQAVLMPNLSKDEYNILWIEHTDKNRLELNFVIPKTHMETGKSIQPFYYANDWKRIDNWKDTINKEFGLSNPKEKRKEQTLSISHQHPFHAKLKELDNHLKMLVEQNQIQSRANVIDYLKRQDVEITRINKNYLSVKLEGMSKAVRLKGDIYKEEFISLEKLKEIRQQQQGKQIEQEYSNQSQDRMIQSVIHKIYQEEKNTEKRKDLIREFFVDLEKEKILQRQKIHELENIGEMEHKSRAGNMFLALSGIGAISVVVDVVKSMRTAYELQVQQEKVKDKYLSKDLER